MPSTLRDTLGAPAPKIEVENSQTDMNVQWET